MRARFCLGCDERNLIEQLICDSDFSWGGVTQERCERPSQRAGPSKDASSSIGCSPSKRPCRNASLPAALSGAAVIASAGWAWLAGKAPLAAMAGMGPISQNLFCNKGTVIATHALDEWNECQSLSLTHIHSRTISLLLSPHRPHSPIMALKFALHTLFSPLCHTITLSPPYTAGTRTWSSPGDTS